MQALFGREAQALAAKLFSEVFEIDLLLLGQTHKEVLFSLLVAQKQVFADAAFPEDAKLLHFRHRVDRRMLQNAVLYSFIYHILFDFFFVIFHCSYYRPFIRSAGFRPRRPAPEGARG